MDQARILEVVECDQCGLTQMVASEQDAIDEFGWTFDECGTSCEYCSYAAAQMLHEYKAAHKSALRS